MDCDLTENLADAIDCALQVRDDLGLQIHNVHIITRTKAVADSELEGFGPEGTIRDTKVQIFPTPKIVDYSHSLRTREGGGVRQGDLVLKQISKSKYSRADIDCTKTPEQGDNIEKYYYINEELYTVISVTEKTMWWNVQVRKHISQGTYFDS